MSDLLSKDEYADIAAKIKFPIDPFINGQFQKTKAGNTMETINPPDGTVLAKVSACDYNDVDYAVEVSRDAFNSYEWSTKHPSERKELLLK